MKNRLNFLASTIILFFIATTACMAGYTIDGDLTDWGFAKIQNPLFDWSDNETWTPNENVIFIVEDNKNPINSGNSHYISIKIKEIGNDYSFFNEPKRVNKNSGELVNEPYGCELYDLEARYFDQDNDNLYIAIITSVNPLGRGENLPEYLALNIDLDPNMGD